jgi:signal peptidase I
MKSGNVQLSDLLSSLIKKVKNNVIKYLNTIYNTSFKRTGINELVSSDKYMGSGAFLFVSFFIHYNIFLLIWPEDPFSTYELPKRVKLLLGLVSKLPTVLLFLVFLYSTVFAYIGFSIVRIKIRFSDLVNNFAYVNGGPAFVANIIIGTCVLIYGFIGKRNDLAFILFFILLVILIGWILFHYIRHLTVLTGKSKLICFIVFFVSLLIGGTIQEYVQGLLIGSYRVPSVSMSPTLTVGDHILSNNFILHTRELERGELVVFRFPADLEKMFVKRIVGLPGDIVEMKNKTLVVNNNEISEDYVEHSDSEIVENRDNFGPVQVSVDSFFLLGDNRDYSLDSRFFGLVPKKNIKGIVYFRYWPLSRSGELKTAF